MRLMPLLALAFLVAGLDGAQGEWKKAQPGWKYEFPRDHGPHGDFRTEWWYFTGRLRAADGREFGYQLTFFRQGVGEGAEDFIPLSRFITREMKFAHFAVTEITGGRFHYFQRVSRGAYGEAGFGNPPRVAWIDGWSAEMGGEIRLKAAEGDLALDLRLGAGRGPIVHGTDGISRKAPGEGHASHYYSLVRIPTAGVLRVGGEEIAVEGSSWFDHEWSTNQLSENQAGWDWISLELDDGSDLMLFRVRARGEGEAFLSGTLVERDGTVVPLSGRDLVLEAGKPWASPVSGARYPLSWKVKVPGAGLELEVNAAVENQELRLQPITYWEGAVRAEGQVKGRKITGAGYLEMTGYAGHVPGLQAETQTAP